MLHVLHEFRFARLKRKIEKNPYIGEKETDGTYLYKEGIYRLRYRIDEAKDKKAIRWLELKRRLSSHESVAEPHKRLFVKFWHYQGWKSFFRPYAIIPLVIAGLIFYFGIIEPQAAKIERYKWIIAKAINIRPEQIDYIGGGWVGIGAKRRIGEEGYKFEYMRYRFNPLNWLFGKDVGYVDRWSGDKYVTHRVSYNDAGDVWLQKYGEAKVHGIIAGNEIKWDSPLGSPLIKKKIFSQEISKEGGVVTILDKERR